MSAVRAVATPASVAALPGFEADKLMQRFAELDARNRCRLLEFALGMIERQRDDTLPPHERKAKRLIDSIERLIELLHGRGHEDTIQTRIWRAMLEEDRKELAAMGVEYFGPAGIAGGTVA